jgi:hypothetical protein
MHDLSTKIYGAELGAKIYGVEPMPRMHCIGNHVNDMQKKKP